MEIRVTNKTLHTILFRFLGAGGTGDDSVDNAVLEVQHYLKNQDGLEIASYIEVEEITI